MSISVNSAEASENLFKKYKESGNLEDRNKIVEKYLYLVEILIKKYLNRGVEYEDLYQVGALALIMAADRFDPDRGISFSAFATPTILGEIKKYFRDKGWALKVPRRLKDLSVRIPQAKIHLEGELGRTPTASDIADYLGVSAEDVLQAVESGRAYSTYSLQQADDESDSEAGSSSFPIEKYTGEEEQGFITLENADFIEKTMRDFSDEEREFCRMRFVDEMTQQQIAKIMGVSQMTVSRIEKKIRKKFKEEYNR